ncbi:MAG: glycosyltransferase family 2 protein [Candidatus Nanohaloarchaea archaeon]
MKKVSVAIPTYNGEKWLKECLESVEKQSFQNIQLVIVDDGSTDETIEMIEQFKEESDLNIAFEKHESNQGMAETRNHCIRLSDGDYVTILDQDDIVHEEKFEKQVEVMEETGSGVCITQVVDLIEETGEKRERNSIEWEGLSKKEKAKLLYENYFRHEDGRSGLPLTTEMVRKDIYDKVGLYDTELFGMNDREFMMRALKATDIELIDKPLLTRRHHSANASSLQERLLEDESKFLEKGLEIWPEFSEAYKRRKSNAELRKGLFSLKNGDIIGCSKNIVSGFYTSPVGSLGVIKQFMKNQFREEDSF